MNGEAAAANYYNSNASSSASSSATPSPRSELLSPPLQQASARPSSGIPGVAAPQFPIPQPAAPNGNPDLADPDSNAETLLTRSQRHDRHRREREEYLSSLTHDELVHTLITTSYERAKYKKAVRKVLAHLIQHPSPNGGRIYSPNADSPSRPPPHPDLLDVIIQKVGEPIPEETRAAHREIAEYKIKLDMAQRQIEHAQQRLDILERQRADALDSESRALSTVKKIQGLRELDIARDEGRRLGFEAGWREAKVGLEKTGRARITMRRLDDDNTMERAWSRSGGGHRYPPYYDEQGVLAVPPELKHLYVSGSPSNLPPQLRRRDSEGSSRPPSRTYPEPFTPLQQPQPVIPTPPPPAAAPVLAHKSSSLEPPAWVPTPFLAGVKQIPPPRSQPQPSSSSQEPKWYNNKPIYTPAKRGSDSGSDVTATGARRPLANGHARASSAGGGSAIGIRTPAMEVYNIDIPSPSFIERNLAGIPSSSHPHPPNPQPQQQPPPSAPNGKPERPGGNALTRKLTVPWRKYVRRATAPGNPTPSLAAVASMLANEQRASGVGVPSSGGPVFPAPPIQPPHSIRPGSSRTGGSRSGSRRMDDEDDDVSDGEGQEEYYEEGDEEGEDVYPPNIPAPYPIVNSDSTYNTHRTMESSSTRISQLPLVTPPRSRSGGSFAASRSAVGRGDDRGGGMSREDLRRRDEENQRRMTQRLADGLRYSDPHEVEDWRRVANSDRSSQARSSGPPRRRPANITAPAPLAPAGIQYTSSRDSQSQHRRSRTASGIPVNGRRMQDPQRLSAGQSQHRKASSTSTPVGITVMPPSHSPSDAGRASPFSPHSHSHSNVGSSTAVETNMDFLSPASAKRPHPLPSKMGNNLNSGNSGRYGVAAGKKPASSSYSVSGSRNAGGGGGPGVPSSSSYAYYGREGYVDPTSGDVPTEPNSPVEEKSPWIWPTPTSNSERAVTPNARKKVLALHDGSKISRPTSRVSGAGGGGGGGGGGQGLRSRRSASGSVAGESVSGGYGMMRPPSAAPSGRSQRSQRSQHRAAAHEDEGDSPVPSVVPLGAPSLRRRDSGVSLASHGSYAHYDPNAYEDVAVWGAAYSEA